MVRTVVIAFLLIGLNVNAQSSDYNTKRGFAAEGYDVVAYFNGKPLEGQKQFTTTYDGVDFKFSNQENLEMFKANPTKYVPQYGGYCAYAMAVTGEKVSIDPETFEINDGNLYLFYNAWGNNTLKKWENGPSNELKLKADKNWEKINSK